MPIFMSILWFEVFPKIRSASSCSHLISSRLDWFEDLLALTQRPPPRCGDWLWPGIAPFRPV